MNHILIENISKSYQKSKTQALKSINLEIQANSCLGLIGLNGAGKSTLLNILLNIVKPDKGHIEINGLRYNNEPDSNRIKSITGSIPEDSKLIDEFSGKEYLFFTGLLYKIKKQELNRRIQDLVELFFDDHAALSRKISTYSTGMRKKIELCSALIHKPEILILDEPFSGLDVLTANLFVDILKAYLNENRIILISSHNLSYLDKLCTDILVLDQGNQIHLGDVESFKGSLPYIDDALVKLFNKKELDLKKLDWLL